MITKVKEAWNRCCHHVHTHEKGFAKLHNFTHLGYFSCVAVHGPYHWFAGVLLFMGLVMWLMHLGEFAE